MRKPKPKIVRASGAPFSDEDIKLIGTELIKIADKHRVGDFRLLDKKIVFAEVEADPNHPLRRFYDWNDRTAARTARVDRTHTLIMAVRIVPGIGKFHRPLPLSITAELPRGKYGTVRKRILTQDALLNDPAFTSAVAGRLRNLDQQLAVIESLFEAYEGEPTGVEPLVTGLREQFDLHYAGLKAAE